jgi:methylamine dehydrogenase accessory protein MauD
MSGVWLVSYWVLWLLVLALVCIAVVLARQIGVLHMRLGPTGARVTSAGPATGTLAPEISAVDLEGHPFTLGGIHDKRTLLLFISPQCPSCAEVAPSVRALARSERATLDVVLVSFVEDSPKILQFLKKYDFQRLTCVLSRRASREYGIFVTPYAVLLSQSGRIISKGVANHIEHLESLLNVAEPEGDQGKLEREASI